jgi:hypothetical protein
MSYSVAINAYNSSIIELSMDELMCIEGGIEINWDRFMNGIVIIGATCFAIACAPEAALVGTGGVIMGVGVIASGASAGYYIGTSLGSQHFSGHFIKRHFLKPVHDSN